MKIEEVLYTKYLRHLVSIRCRLREKPKFTKQKYDVVHFIAGEKFTEGYIKFMKKYFPDVKQLFVTTSSQYDGAYKSDEVVIFKRLNEAMVNRRMLEILHLTDKFVFSGVFDETAVALIPDWLIGKTFFQFWGADFYRYREEAQGFKRKIRFRLFRKQCQYAGGLIFLLHGEYAVFKKIMKVENDQVFIAPVPGEPGVYQKAASYKKKVAGKRILLGNSATQTNHHVKMIDSLKKFKHTQIEMHCPLAYGDSNYRDEIIKYGFEVFGQEQFMPLCSYVTLDEYFQYLANIDVAVFFNDRQQATANIEYLLAMGKKAYLNPRTSMYEHYRTIGCRVYNIDDLPRETIEETMMFTEDDAASNQKCILKYNSDENFVGLWQAVYGINND